MSSAKQTVLAIGGTGAQGISVVKGLARDSKYNVRVLTRSTKSKPALELAALPGVTIVSGDGYNEAGLHSAFSSGIDIAFVNTNGFAIGEKAEIYWGIRIFEIAAEHGVKHFIWANLESSYKVSGYQPRFRTGHFDGKHKVADWISAQPKDGLMKWSILTSCMYLEMFSELLRPFPETINGEEVMVFKAPVGDGRPPMIFLEDLGRYGRWLIDNPEKSSGMNLKISTDQVGWEEVAQAFTEVTGKKAVFRDVTLDEYFASGAFPDPDAKVGHSVGHDDDTLQTYRENFSGFWNTWKENVLQRDDEVLDEILPTRVKSIKEWMQITGYTGKPGSVLKDYSDARRAPKVEV
ncbi:NAD(P)-binding protein [Mollisia scopiformis]|uniref:NAD(P)-binding protein n=1 Tax=Mollisia scopiformis TaxID=149040 RepID=A0A194X9G0_MOLSC|nr:NAD(P)-binding protein [Mollisia scopiformis]KUJ16759.1 NAD(P)-binding protein [Mollisia scopiformis]